MTRPLLSILMATMPSRRAIKQRITAQLARQFLDLHAPAEVQMIDDEAPGQVGAKRQRLLERATGDYVAFVDDDDLLAPDYLARILAALESRPDVVGIVVKITLRDEPLPRIPFTEHSLRHRDVPDKAGNGPHRVPNHLNPMRRDLALQAGYRDMSWGEDTDFALRVLPLLQTEVFTGPEWLYHYDWWPGGRPSV